MKSLACKDQVPETPAFVVDEKQVLSNLRPLQALRQTSACKILYSIKALPLGMLLERLGGEVDGFSVSSLFEARLARETGDQSTAIHLTTPGLRPDEFTELAGLCSHISFNSLSQFQQLKGIASGYAGGLRINPQLSFAPDERYDPCRRHSKLGVPLHQLAQGLPADVTGLHFHTVFGHEDFLPLSQTLEKLEPIISAHPQLRWLNLGGGYRYDRIAETAPLTDWIVWLKQRYALEVYLEPGKAIVGSAGYLLTTVLDRFTSDGKVILVLDTSVNHHPEVFEYQRKPLLQEESADGNDVALLVGSSCLAGDVFGEYRFDRLPEVGERLVFAEVGAYSLIKANRFNGYDLPLVYYIREEGGAEVKRYGFESYRQQWR